MSAKGTECSPERLREIVAGIASAFKQIPEADRADFGAVLRDELQDDTDALIEAMAVLRRAALFSAAYAAQVVDHPPFLLGYGPRSSVLMNLLSALDPARLSPATLRQLDLETSRLFTDRDNALPSQLMAAIAELDDEDAFNQMLNGEPKPQAD